MQEYTEKEREELYNVARDIACAQWIKDNLEIFRHPLDGPNQPYKYMLYDLFEDHRLGRLYLYDSEHPDRQLLNSVCKAVIYNTMAESVGFVQDLKFVITPDLEEMTLGRFRTNDEIALNRNEFEKLLLPDTVRTKLYGDCNLYCTGNIVSTLIHETRHFIQNTHSPKKSPLVPQKNKMMRQIVATMLWRQDGEPLPGDKKASYIIDPMEVDARAFATQRLIELNLSRPDRKPFLWDGVNGSNIAIMEYFTAVQLDLQKTLDQWNASVYRRYNWTMRKKYPNISEEYLIPEIQLFDHFTDEPVPSEHLKHRVKASKMPSYNITTAIDPEEKSTSENIHEEFMRQKRHIETGRLPETDKPLPFSNTFKSKNRNDTFEY